MKEVLITGATGNVGESVLNLLAAQGASVRAGIRKSPSAAAQRTGVSYVHFDFADPTTYRPALTGVERLFLVRPPAIADAKQFINPFIDAAKEAGVRHVVFLSLLGVEKNPVVPHRAIEDHILAVGLPYTFLRPGFFMQNLSTTHRREIAERNEIFIPAGKGKTSFIDTRDIAAVAARVLTEPGHENRAYALTGAEASDYYEVAAILSEVLGRRIVYANPSLPRFIWTTRRSLPLGFVLVMAALYTVGRFGLAATITPDLANLLDRPPITLRQFIEDTKDSWI
jgi:uncharacterized protein YbjT (DUF2867 family)